MITITNGFLSGWTGIYIGRKWKDKNRSPLANPYSVEQYGRDRCIDMYKKWLWSAILEKREPTYSFLKQLVNKYRNKEDIQLDCFCYPKKCHGEIIKLAIEYLGDDNNNWRLS